MYICRQRNVQFASFEFKVSIDGVDVRDLNVKALRTMVGVVAQEPILFDGSLEENVRLGRDDVTHKEIVQALKLANAYNFIHALPQVITFIAFIIQVVHNWR